MGCTMWQEVGVAALVGLALSDSWLCLMMGASFAASDRRLGWGFLVGRTLGVLGLLLLVGLVGAALLPPRDWLVGLFAASSLAVAAALAVSALRPGLLGGCHEAVGVACDGGEPEVDGTGGNGCGQGCDGCSMSHRGEVGRQPCPRLPSWLLGRLAGRSPWVAGLALGGFRGAMPCLKVLLIVPLLVASPPGTVVLMAGAYALTSTVYPVIGFTSGRTIAKVLGQGWRLRLAGAAGVAIVGVVTLLRFYQSTCEA